jgi:hypothetical protein
VRGERDALAGPIARERCDIRRASVKVVTSPGGNTMAALGCETTPRV